MFRGRWPMVAVAMQFGELMRVDLLDCTHKPTSKFKMANRFELLIRLEECNEMMDSNQDRDEEQRKQEMSTAPVYESSDR